MSQKFLNPIEVDGQVSAEYLDLSTTTSHSVNAGEIAWNSIDGTFDIGLLNGVTLQAGQEMHFYGKATEAISNGNAVMFAGVQGDHILIAKATPAAINANPEYFMGVATQDFTTNQFGYVTAFGNVRGLNTTGYTLGTVLYFDSNPLSSPGLLTEVKPTAPNAKVEVAAVVRVHATQGILMVRPHTMPKLSDVQDVKITGISTNNILYWTTANRWENGSVSTVLGYTPANSSHTHTFDSLTSKTGGTGTYQTSGDFRAPIFYDSNNTGYYLDPASTSNLYNVTANTFVKSGGTSSQFLKADGSVDSNTYLTSVTNITGYSGTLISEDNRTISPSELAANRLKFGFTSWNNNNTSPYADFIHLRSYQDASGGSDNLVMFKKSGIGMRIWQQTYGSTTAYSTYKDIAFTDGTNATGTWSINITGNAGTLETPRTINGTSFNGSSDIETSYWGTGRTITIGATGKTVDGSGNVSWTLAEIGAQAAGSYAASSHTHPISQITNLQTTLDSKAPTTSQFVQSSRDFPLGTLISTTIDYSQTTGDSFLLELKGNTYGGGVPLDMKVQGYIYYDTIINATGYTINSAFTYVRAMNIGGFLCFWIPTGGYWQGFDAFCSSTMGGGSINKVTTITNSAEPAGTKKVTINLTYAVLSNNTLLNNWNAAYNGKINSASLTASTLTLSQQDGTTITASVPTFNQNTTGNAATATTLQTSRTINGTSFNGSANIETSYWGATRTITIGNTGKTVNGSGNQSWSLAEIGAQAALTNPVTGTGTTNYVSKFTGTTTLGNSQIFDNGTNVGVNNTSPNYRLDIGGNLRFSTGYLNSEDYFERVFSNGISFPNGTANLAADIIFGNLSFWGYIEVEITGSFSNQNTSGKLTKVFAVGTNPNNLIYTNDSRVSESLGTIKDNIAIGNFSWDATNSRYRIPISHIVSTGNPYTVRVRMFTNGGGASVGARAVFNTISISSNYTLSALPKQYSYYNERLGVNTDNPTEALHVSGRGRFTTIDNGAGDFATISGTGVITRRTANQTLLDIGAAASSHTHTFDSLTNKTLGTGTYQTSGDFRAPIFYDSDNTGFYSNPAGLSNFSTIIGNSIQVHSIKPVLTIQDTDSSGDSQIGYISYRDTGGVETAWLGFGSESDTDFTVRNTLGRVLLNGKYSEAVGNFRAPIFYDSNNTGYYLDPASTSNLYNVTANTFVKSGGTSSQFLKADGSVDSNTYLTSVTNITGLMVNNLAAPALIDGLTTANFRSTLFGTTSNGYQISAARWNTTPAPLVGLGPYGTMLSWSGSDTHGFIAMDYSLAALRVGGGNANNINWTRRVLLDDTWTNSKYFGPGGEIYGTVFYDANDSTYYFDGSSTGDSIRVAGDIVAYYSDDRLKDRKGNIENALEKVLSLNGFYYEANQKAQKLGYKKKMEVGVSAQEVEAILPELIKDAPIGQGYKTLDYGRLTPLLIEAIKDQQKQIEELKELVNKLITK